MKGCKRFIDRLWKLQDITVEGDNYSDDLMSAMHKTIKKVSEDIEAMKFNTAIAAVMALLNQIYDAGSITRVALRDLILIVNPFAPHITEEIWEKQNFGGMLNEAAWPSYDEAKCVDATIEIPVQVNGKIRERIHVAPDAEQPEVLERVHALEKIAAECAGKTIVKEIYVKGRIVNIVVK